MSSNNYQNRALLKSMSSEKSVLECVIFQEDKNYY